MRGRPKGRKDTKPRKPYNCRHRNQYPLETETPPTLFSTTPTETPVVETETPQITRRFIMINKCSARIQSPYDIDGWCQCSRDIYSDGLCKQHYTMDRKGKSPCSTKLWSHA